MPNYKSIIHFQEVTAAQYLAEIMCLRQATKQKEKLTFKFWDIPKWKMIYRQQIIAANSLLKIYEPEPIIAAINRKDCSYIFSLRFPGLNQKILEEKDKLDKLTVRLSKVKNIEYNEESTTKTPAKPFQSNNKANKLRNLDE